MTVASKFRESALQAYSDLVKLSDRHGGTTASVMAADDANVPNAITGEFIITGANRPHTATNLARAYVVLRSVANTRTIWKMEDGKRTRVVWK